VDGSEAEGVGAKLPTVRWSWQRATTRCVAAPVTDGGGGEVREVHHTPMLFGEARVGHETHRRQQILRERRRWQYSTPMGESEVATSSVGIEG
jgi:hypothetical protein